MVKMVCVMLLFSCIFFLSCPPGEVLAGDFRQDMRDFVQGISEYTKDHTPGFIIIPQNGHALMMENGEPDGPVDLTYVGAIDGIGREELFYGYDEDDVATPTAEQNEMIDFLDIAEALGVQALSIDYCSIPTYMTNSYNWNFDLGYISFAADRRELDNIPNFPFVPYHVNTDTITTLADAKNFLYLINPGNYETKGDFIAELKATNYDVLIIDLYFHETEILDSFDFTTLKNKNSGQERLVIAYMSIGEAEDYRYYWNPDWDSDPPDWIEAENPEWEGNYKVRYWDKEWRDIIYGKDTSYVLRIIDAGFDGVYLDIIDAYEYFEDNY